LIHLMKTAYGCEGHDSWARPGATGCADADRRGTGSVRGILRLRNFTEHRNPHNQPPGCVKVIRPHCDRADSSQRRNTEVSEVAVGAVHKTRRGVMWVEKQEWFTRLITQGVSNAEACRMVGINRKTGTRWRYGRTIRNTAGERALPSSFPTITPFIQ